MSSQPTDITPQNGGIAAARLGVIIVAAGGGTRMGGGLEKQYRNLAGCAVVTHSVRSFISHPATGNIVIVIAAGRLDAARAALGNLLDDPRITLVEGGARRQDSVQAGLLALSNTALPLVAIHDAARPFLPTDVIDRLIEAMDSGADAALPVLAVTDTLKQVSENRVIGTTDRSSLARAQTPQIFRLPAILDHHRQHDQASEVTDDIRLVEDSGGTVVTVAGDERLMKLTTAGDFAILNAMTTASDENTMTSFPSIADIRTGNGYDVHRFSDGPGPVHLGGIEIPSDRGLDAHSDGDVGLHALCDAIFGALADGDIGSHFPPSDDKWKGASSDQFLTFAAERCASRGARILHLDLTLICEVPKIGPHRQAMRERIATLAGISIDRVAVKATTSEKLGFTGRGEGIAAQATATIFHGTITAGDK